MDSSSSSAPRLPTNVAVLGLGIVGSLTALAILQRSDVATVTIYELRPAPATIGGALNISPNAHRVMGTLGVSPRSYAGSTPWVLFQNDQGKKVGVFKYGGAGDKWAQGYEGMRAQRNDIQDDLIVALRTHEQSGRLKILFNKRATAIDESPYGARISFADGDVASFDVVVGADGIHSFARGQILRQVSTTPSEKTPLTQIESGTLAKPSATYSGVTTIYGLVPTEGLDPALLAPLDAHQSIRTISPHAGLFAISYSRADRSAIHWFSSRSPPIPPSPDVPEPSTEAVRSELLDTYSTFPEPIPALIRATERLYYWPVYRLSPMPEAWYGQQGRIVLVGDAAHAMPPHAAQGVGMGVEDALLVAKVIARLCQQSPAPGGGKIVQPSAELWRREYQAKRAARVEHFVAHAEAQGRARMDATFTIVGRAREWALWAAFPLINALAWLHGRGLGGFGSGILSMVGLGDVQGWGYDPDQEVVSLEGL